MVNKINEEFIKQIGAESDESTTDEELLVIQIRKIMIQILASVVVAVIYSE